MSVPKNDGSAGRKGPIHFHLHKFSLPMGSSTRAAEVVHYILMNSRYISSH